MGKLTTQTHTVNGNSSDFSNNDATITLTLDSAIADEAQVRVSYAGSTVEGRIRMRRTLWRHFM